MHDAGSALDHGIGRVGEHGYARGNAHALVQLFGGGGRFGKNMVRCTRRTRGAYILHIAAGVRELEVPLPHRLDRIGLAHHQSAQGGAA